MRIFSLATDEAVVVDDDIVVEVLGIDGDEVQLAIENSDGMFTEFDWANKSLRHVAAEPAP